MRKIFTNRILATEVARLWKNETPEVKAYYGHLAELEAQEHKQRYPDYRYNPGAMKNGTV